jgi:hypothetical protein
MIDAIKIAKPHSGDTRFTAFFFDGSKQMRPFTFRIDADAQEIQSAAEAAAKANGLGIHFLTSYFEEIAAKAAANRPAPAAPRTLTPAEQRQALEDKICNLEASIREAEEAAYEKDCGGVAEAGKKYFAELAEARKALIALNASQPAKEISAEQIWNL